MIEFDELDEKVVALLQEDGRKSIRAVARTVGVSESAIRKRIRRLSEAGAISYGLVVDVHATGLRVSGMMWIDVRPSFAKRIAEFIAAMELCSMCSLTSGETIIRAYMHAADIHAMTSTIDEISAQNGVMKVTFREVIEHTCHRYQYMVQAVAGRWGKRTRARYLGPLT